jgi:hypothetical protein
MLAIATFFAILADHTNPIEAGRLPNGPPDLCFRGAVSRNSEIGSETLGIASFYLDAVCMTRNLWGADNSSRSPSGIQNLLLDDRRKKVHQRLRALQFLASAPFVGCRHQGGTRAHRGPY